MLTPQSLKGFSALASIHESDTKSAEEKVEAAKFIDVTSMPREMKLTEDRTPKVSYLESRKAVNYDEKKDNPADHDERCGCSSCVILRRARATGLATHSEICVECCEVAPGHDDVIGLFYCEKCWETHPDTIVSPTAAPVTSNGKCSSCGIATENLLMCENCLRMQWYLCPGQNEPVGGEVGHEAHLLDNEETKVEHLMQDYDDVLGTDPYGYRDTSPRAVTPDTEPPISCTEDIVEDKPDDDITSLQYKVHEAGKIGEQSEERVSESMEMKDLSNREHSLLSCAGNTKLPSSKTGQFKSLNMKTPSSRTQLLEIKSNQQKAQHNLWSSNAQESSAIRNDGVKLVQALIRDFSIIKEKAASPSI